MGVKGNKAFSVFLLTLWLTGKDKGSPAQYKHLGRKENKYMPGHDTMNS